MDYPTISVLGRSKNTLHLDDIPLYEMQLDAAIKSSYPGLVKEWQLVECETINRQQYTIYIQTFDENVHAVILTDSLYKALYEQRSELNDVNLQQKISVVVVKEFEKQKINGDVKSQRIMLLKNKS